MKLKENVEIMAARKGLRLGQLADKAGVSRQTFYVKGLRHLYRFDCVQDRRRLGVDVTEIIKEED